MLKNRYTFIIAVVVAACGLMAYINNASFTMVPHPAADKAAEDKLIQDNLARSTVANGMESKPLVTEATYGAARGAIVIATLGYTANEFLAVHPQEENTIASILSLWSGTHTGLCAKIVCLDIPPSDRSDPSTANVPLGLAIDGKVVPGCGKDIVPGGLDTGTVFGGLGRGTYPKLKALGQGAPPKSHGV
jgi:hypothetical protein